MTANTSDSVTVIDEEFTPALPLIEGAIIKFSCPPEYALIGPNVTTCMENGEWEPDPREVQCKHTGWDKHLVQLVCRGERCMDGENASSV